MHCVCLFTPPWPMLLCVAKLCRQLINCWEQYSITFIVFASPTLSARRPPPLGCSLAASDAAQLLQQLILRHMLQLRQVLVVVCGIKVGVRCLAHPRAVQLSPQRHLVVRPRCVLLGVEAPETRGLSVAPDGNVVAVCWLLSHVTTAPKLRLPAAGRKRLVHPTKARGEATPVLGLYVLRGCLGGRWVGLVGGDGAPVGQLLRRGVSDMEAWRGTYREHDGIGHVVSVDERALDLRSCLEQHLLLVVG